MSDKFTDVATAVRDVLEEVERAVVGKRNLLEMIMATTLAGGHVLLEDFPGLGKTLIARSFATVLGLGFKRIQFTPDLLPGDITGGYILDRKENKFQLRQGPIFTNIVLADEINRASPKTQSALLEAMQEGQVTLEGKSMPLPDPFLVMATQNPIEYEGTFPLPEAQLDRFMLKLSIGYPGIADEREILNRRRIRRREDVELKAVMSASKILKLRNAIETVHVDADLEEYIVRIVHETRNDRRVAVGASPRASLAFLKLARAHAALSGRNFVLPDDIKRYAAPVLTHRIILLPEYWVARDIVGEVINDVLRKVPVPVTG
ncbi:MAG: ATPase [Anaerolineaceae bacterium]|nr:MAG: MoxR family ATPase [Chloroflexota bacterium]GJQ37072.1 MAG: ATPase [Anaerolineaceae bacterium]